jgi:putative flippase GtrA
MGGFLNELQQSRSIGRFIVRYAALGIAGNLIGYTTYLVLSWLGVPFRLAMTLLYSISICISFTGNRNWAFGHRGNVMRAAWRFSLAHLVGYVLNLGLLTVFVDKLGYPHEWVQAASILAVGGFLFAIFKLFVFRESQTKGYSA